MNVGVWCTDLIFFSIHVKINLQVLMQTKTKTFAYVTPRKIVRHLEFRAVMLY